jgi:hypothetical protein
MPNVSKDTRVLKDPITGELVSVPAAEADARAEAEGLDYASLSEIAKFNEREKYGSAGQTALAATELALESATLGLSAADDEDSKARRRVLRRDSPTLAFGAELAGAAPGIAAGALTGGVAPALGVGARAARVASIVAEGGVSGFAQEQVQAREEGRDIDIGNILLYGVGGEVFGRVVPKAFGAGISKVVGRGEDALAGGADNVLVRAEQRATQSGSDLAEAAPGPERDRFLKDNARDLVNGAAERVRKNLDEASSKFQDLGDISKKRNKIASLVSKEHVGQDRWVHDQLDNLQEMRAELDGGSRASASPVDLSGKSLDDLGALTQKESFREGSFTGLRSSEEFKRTGRVPKEFSGRDFEEGIKLRAGEPGEGREWYLVDGRHRLTVAKESGTPQIWGTVYDAEGEQVFRGFIPLKKAKAGKGLGEVQGLQGIVKKLGTALDDIEVRLTSSRKAADRFIAADQAKRTLQKFHVFLGRSRMQAMDASYHDQLMSVVDAVQETIRRGLEDESLWGRAARFQADVNSAWHNRWFQGAPVTEGDLARITGKEFDAKPIIEFDPAKVRSFLEKDKVGRGLTEEKLNDVLDGYQEMAEAHRRWGMSSDAELDKLQRNVAEVRRSLADADEIQAAVPRAAKAEAAEAAMDQLITSGLPVLGSAYVATKRALRNINTAGKSHIRGTANALVNGTRKVGRALEGAGDKGAGAVGVVGAGQLRERQTTDDRFKGTYPSITQSFQAKREQIVTAMQEPGQLSDAITASMGDLPEAFPDVHFRLAMRMTEAANYLSQNMPPSVQNSLLERHATPPDIQSIRQFARLWEAVMDPGAVVQDFATMQATVPQARAIETVHPDIFAQLQNDAIEAIAESPKMPSYERLRYLNQMFRLGPALGGVWKPSVARNIKNSMVVAPTGGSLPNPSMESFMGPTNPRGIASIADGPSSAG